MTVSRRVLAWGAVIIGALFLLIAVSALWNGLWSWLPWSAESKLARAEARADYAESDADARSLEAQGERESTQRIDTYHRETITIRDLTAETVAQARSAPDANEPLDSDRADRLRAGDAGLCALAAPGTCPAA